MGNDANLNKNWSLDQINSYLRLIVSFSVKGYDKKKAGHQPAFSFDILLIEFCSFVFYFGDLLERFKNLSSCPAAQGLRESGFFCFQDIVGAGGE